jgi:hypothetical protein
MPPGRLDRIQSSKLYVESVHNVDTLWTDILKKGIKYREDRHLTMTEFAAQLGGIQAVSSISI